MTALVVADTTVCSNFAHTGQPRLVLAAYPGDGETRSLPTHAGPPSRRGEFLKTTDLLRRLRKDEAAIAEALAEMKGR